MTPHEFDTLMNVAKSRWGEKAYPNVIKDRIWFFVKDLPVRSFERMVYTLFDVSRYAPMPQEFKMLAYAEKERLGIKGKAEPETKPSHMAKCQDCGDSGNLFARHKRNNTSATFRCHCQAGSSRPQAQGAQWNNYWAQQYEPERIYLGIKGDFSPRKNLSLVKMVQEFANLQPRDHRKGELRPISLINDEEGDNT